MQGTYSSQMLAQHTNWSATQPHQPKKAQPHPSSWKWLILKMQQLVSGALTPVYCFHVPVKATDALTPAWKLNSTL